MNDLKLTDKVDLMYKDYADKNTKKLKMPRKAKVSKSKFKKGWIGIIKVDENGNISGTKKKIIDSTFDLEDTYHATNGKEILLWEGKFPVVIQPSWKTNPLQVRKDTDINETYGKKYIMARMHLDTIKQKSKQMGSIAMIIGLAIAAYVAYSLFTGGV